tara:strand:- start:7732 stop:7941 length:210 start_codon:yes stop_codon:yes gene_type:complete
MNKEKLIKGALWLCGFSTSIILCSFCLFVGFNNQRHGDSKILIVGFILLPFVFYFAYKGFKLILEAIFD